ncbi:MAG: FAD-dependent monooxygenase [Polyangiaceae bacterium]
MTAQEDFAHNVDVLVVGAGPTGLLLAAELLRHQCSVLLVDKAAGPSAFSKGVVVHARTLEILDAIGLADELVARGVVVRGLSAFSDGEPWLAADFEELETRFPYLLSVAQTDTEAVLSRWLERLGGRVVRGVELVALTGGEATVESSSGRATVRAKWIVGCDGAHSTVRTLAAIPFAGKTYQETFVLGDLEIGWEGEVAADRALLFTGKGGAAAFFPMRANRWRLVAAVEAALAPGRDAPSLEELQSISDRMTLGRAKLRDPVWTHRFEVHSRQAATYREGRVLLAGDAAHAQSPVGGQGLNTGLQDAHNLGFKLALACRGAGSAALLDSYHAERHPIGARVLADTDLVTRLGSARSSFARTLRDGVVRALAGVARVEHRVLAHLAELDVGYEASPIVGEARGVCSTRRSTTASRRGRRSQVGEPSTRARALAPSPRTGRSLERWRTRRSGRRRRSFACSTRASTRCSRSPVRAPTRASRATPPQTFRARSVSATRGSSRCCSCFSPPRTRLPRTSRRRTSMRAICASCSIRAGR